ncbi:MAG: SRPBCC family protein, partial [Deltaproteobacteria bacterium]|nr:SRPBCC family protein [Nannocystaceae bacterium]
MPSTKVVIERSYEAPPELVWALLGDSNRFDRAMKLGLPVYAWRDVDGRREHVARAQQDGITMEWIEPPYEWVEARLLDGTRYFTVGPLGSGGMKIELFAEGTGTRARATVWGDSPHWYMALVKPLVERRIRNRTAAFMDAVGEVLRSGPLPGDPEAPPIVRIQPLLASRIGAAARGAVTSSDAVELERRARRLRDAGIGGEATDRVVALLRDHPDEEVAQIQPFARARAWGLDRREVLRTFLHATRAGLLDLNWQINCPVCKVSAGVASSLDELGKQVHCGACNIRYDVDFGTSVEAVFRCNQAVRAVQPAVFCAASPSLRPHVLAQLRVA